MKTNKFIIGLFALSVFGLTSCKEKVEVEKSILLQKLIANAEDTLVDPGTRTKGSGHNSDFSFRTDSIHEYAAGQNYSVNDTLVNSSIKIVIDLWVKSSNPIKGDGFAASFQNDQAIAQWLFFDLVNYGAKSNEWVNIKDSVTIPADKYTTPSMYFKFFGFAPNKKAIIDFDDINITVKKVYKTIED